MKSSRWARLLEFQKGYLLHQRWNLITKFSLLLTAFSVAVLPWLLKPAPSNLTPIEGSAESTESETAELTEPEAPDLEARPEGATPTAPTDTDPPPSAQPNPNPIDPNAADRGTPSPANCPAQATATASNNPANNPAGTPPAPTWGALVDSLIPGLTTYFAARPFPEIHTNARAASVPIMMYHDIIAEKEVFFDVTPEEFEADLQLIKEKGLTPISADQLVQHLSTGTPLPEKPILLTFDDGYRGHYQFVFPLLKKYGYPALFSIYPYKVGRDYGRPGLNWEQVREMAADPLVTIASHSVTHPADLRELPDDKLRQEIFESKSTLESQLGISIKHFVYPEGKYDDRVKSLVAEAGYQSAMTMSDEYDKVAGESESLLNIERIGQSKLEDFVDKAYGGAPLPPFGKRFNFNNEVRLQKSTVNEVPLIFAAGGRPITIHADSRYQVWEIMKGTEAVAAVDGGFFSLEHLNSNDMIGPVYSQSTGQFVSADDWETRSIKGRPLVLISPDTVLYLPYEPEKHNSLAGIQAELPNVTDAFVAAAWLVRDGLPQPPEAFGTLFDFDAARDRAFWGINQAGEPVVGVSGDYVDSISLGEALARAGLRDAVMLDSGASASLAFQGESQMSYEPRPVPHVVALLPATAGCPTVTPAVNPTPAENSAPAQAPAVTPTEPQPDAQPISPDPAVESEAKVTEPIAAPPTEPIPEPVAEPLPPELPAESLPPELPAEPLPEPIGDPLQ